MLQDYEDDDEHAGGRTILRLLEKSDIFNRAVFVSRTYDGTHIGVKRFSAIEDAVRAVLARFSFNEIIGSHQFMAADEDWQQGSSSTPNLRGRPSHV